MEESPLTLVEGSAPSSQGPSVSGGVPLERTIRFAAYLIGGVLALTYGIASVAAGLGALLNCAFQTPACPSVSPYFLYDILPTTVAGAILLVIAAVLFLFARRARQSPS